MRLHVPRLVWFTCHCSVCLKKYGQIPALIFLSNVVKQLNIYLGMKHVVSIVDRHINCGVDGPSKQIFRLLKALVQDERAVSR